MSAVPRGRFVWYEMMASDIDAAKSFYTQLIGWTTKPGPITETAYTEWVNGAASVGGLMQLSDQAKEAGAPPHWLAYVAVPSVDETLQQAEGLGGKKLMGPMDIPGVGRIAVLQDPQTAVFAIYTPAGEAPGHDGMPANGEFSWHELWTSDFEAGFAFYSALFGWVKGERMEMGPGAVYQMYGLAPDQPLGGMINRPPHMPGPPANWLCYITVPDVRAKIDQVKALGGQVLNGPDEVPGGDVVAQCMDSQGAAFALHSKKPPA